MTVDAGLWRRDTADGLRVAAAFLNQLPLPPAAHVGPLVVAVHVAEAEDVRVAAMEAGTVVHEFDGHTSTTIDCLAVRLQFVHVDDAAMVAYRARTSYTTNINNEDTAS